jgi:hypothetical protein
MTEIWVPYGPVEVSFDIKQENLSQILEPHPSKISIENIEEKAAQSAGADSILFLSGTPGAVQILDELLSKNQGIRKILYPKSLATLAKKKSQEHQIPNLEEFNFENLKDVEPVDGTPAKIFSQLKQNSNLIVLTSVHLDPLFGLSSAASDLISLSPESKAEAFKRSVDELPCKPIKSSASWYATRVLQTCPNINVVEVIERAGDGPLDFFIGEPEATHAKVLDFWSSNLSVSFSSNSDRIIFGCGGVENDKTLTDALGRAFFYVVENVAHKDSGTRICMLAECAKGLGSEAFLRFVTGRLMPGVNLDQISYLDGLEVLLSFYKIQGDYELALVSTLPKYYGEKFQFKMIGGARDAPASLLSAGSRAKILVIPNGASFSVASNADSG